MLQAERLMVKLNRERNYLNRRAQHGLSLKDESEFRKIRCGGALASKARAAVTKPKSSKPSPPPLARKKPARAGELRSSGRVRRRRTVWNGNRREENHEPSRRRELTATCRELSASSTHCACSMSFVPRSNRAR